MGLKRALLRRKPTERERQLSVTKKALQSLLEAAIERFGGLPTNYATLDCESTGFRKKDDLIWDFSLRIVRDMKIVDRFDVVLDWTKHEMIEEGWLRKRIADLKANMRANGRECHLTWELLQTGMTPEEGMELMGKKLLQCKKERLPFVGHNIIRFDVPRISSQLEEWIGLVFKFRRKEVIDTAAIEKGAGAEMEPKPGETFWDYSIRVLNRPIAGVKYTLSTHCVEKYDLVKKFKIRTEQLHRAGEDSDLVHYLMETYREIIAPF